MPGSIVHHTSGAVAHPAGGPRPQAGPSASTADVAFGGALPTWDSLPDETRQVAHWGTPVVAEQVERLGRGALKIGGVLHQRTIGWRAHLDRVVVATAVRPLTERPDGRMAPSGPWRHHDAVVHLPSGPVRRREGVVAVDGVAPDGSPAAPGPRLPLDQQSAAESCSYLPAAVQQGFLDAVPAPSLWLGELVQYSEGDYPVRHELTSLRLDDRRAVVLTAERRLPASRRYRDPADATAVLATTAWNVTQLTYDLAPAGTSRGVLDREVRS